MSDIIPSPLSIPSVAGSAAQAANAMILGEGAVVSSDKLISDISASVLSWISTALTQQVDAAAALGAKVSAPIVAALNSAEQTTNQIKSAITGSIQGQMTAAGGASPGGTVDSGIKEGQYRWNVYQFKHTPYQTRMSDQVGIPGADMSDWCFRGSWEDFYDGNAWRQGIEGVRPPAWCYGPGGPAAGSGSGPVVPGPCAQWAVWVFPAGAADPCSYAYCDGSVPDPSGAGGSKMLFSDQASAQAFVASAKCQAPVSGGLSPDQYYAGCVSGSPVSWLTTATPPSGVSGQVGPFADVSTAIKALGSTCTLPTGGGTGTGTGTGTGGTGTCCPTEVTKLPECIYIDLCSPDRVAEAIYLGLCKWTQSDGCFYEPVWRALKKALCEWVKDPECACIMQTAEKFAVEDCDGEYGKAVNSWLGVAGRPIADPAGLDAVMAQAIALTR